MIIDFGKKAAILKHYLSRVSVWHELAEFDADKARLYMLNSNLICQEIEELHESAQFSDATNYIDALLDILWEAGQVRAFLQNYYDLQTYEDVLESDGVENPLETLDAVDCFYYYLRAVDDGECDSPTQEILHYLDAIYNEVCIELMRLLTAEELEQVTREVITSNFSKFLIAGTTSAAVEVARFTELGLEVTATVVTTASGESFYVFKDVNGKIRKPSSFNNPKLMLSAESIQRIEAWVA